MGGFLVSIPSFAACAPPREEAPPTSPSGRVAASVSRTSVVRPSPEPSGREAVPPSDAPGPDERIPRDARELAQRLSAELRALYRAIDAWQSDGDPGAWPPPPEVELRALSVQRAVRLLASEPGLARRTIPRVPHRFRFELARNVHASAGLFAFQRPIASVEAFRTATPEPADVLLGWFRRAERRFGVDRELLAAVMLVETRFGRIVSRSVAGASGPMQFLPATWEAYGMGGDVRDPRDAIMGAANYLRASGAPEDERRALYAYNPVDAYVRAVSAYADVMRRRPDAYYAYYNWQVFVRTVDGDVRITGPGV